MILSPTCQLKYSGKYDGGGARTGVMLGVADVAVCAIATLSFCLMTHVRKLRQWRVSERARADFFGWWPVGSRPADDVPIGQAFIISITEP